MIEAGSGSALLLPAFVPARASNPLRCDSQISREIINPYRSACGLPDAVSLNKAMTLP